MKMDKTYWTYGMTNFYLKKNLPNFSFPSWILSVIPLIVNVLYLRRQYEKPFSQNFVSVCNFQKKNPWKLIQLVHV